MQINQMAEQWKDCLDNLPDDLLDEAGVARAKAAWVARAEPLA